MLDIYANILRSYKANYLTKDEFFRLGWILSNIFSADLLYLNELYKKGNIENSVRAQKLEYYGLALSRSETRWNAGNVSLYSVSPLGIKMLSCGIDYENHGKYKINEGV